MRESATILHVDLDAFFASVEQRENPELQGKPVIVGGVGGRGVVAAASYEAREFGVRSAMPTAHARRLCPHAVFLSPSFDLYSEASRAVMEIFRDVTPLVEPLSLDEAFLDVAGAQRIFGTPYEIAQHLRKTIRERLHLPASVGVANSKFVAKLASDSAKPDGCLEIAAGDEIEYVQKLPVERMWGVGPATRRKLDRFGIETIGDLAKVSVAALEASVGKAMAIHLHELSWCRDHRDVEPGGEMKSVGHERTFSSDIADPAQLAREVTVLCDMVGSRLRKNNLAGKTVQLKYRYPDFRTITRSKTLPRPTDSTKTIGETAHELLRKVEIGAGARLLGVSISQLTEVDQLVLSAENREIDLAVDSIRERFGDDAVIGGAQATSVTRRSH